MRIRTALPSLLLLLAFAVVAYAADEKKASRKESGKLTGLDQFKQLAGDWVGKTVDGKEGDKLGEEMQISYKVTAGGSAVVETIAPKTAHEMVTVIHQDGDNLVLTHYCMLGNQPHMKAEGNGHGNQVAFKFDHASNLKSEKDMHMHDVTYTFVDKDTIKTEWTHFNDGKAAGVATFELKRKK